MWCVPTPCAACLDRLPGHSKLALRVTSPTRDVDPIVDEDSLAARRRSRSAACHCRRFCKDEKAVKEISLGAWHGRIEASTHLFYSHMMPPSKVAYPGVTQNCSLQVLTSASAKPTSGSCLTALPAYATVNAFVQPRLGRACSRT